MPLVSTAQYCSATAAKCATYRVYFLFFIGVCAVLLDAEHGNSTSNVVCVGQWRLVRFFFCARGNAISRGASIDAIEKLREKCPQSSEDYVG